MPFTPIKTEYFRLNEVYFGGSVCVCIGSCGSTLVGDSDTSNLIFFLALSCKHFYSILSPQLITVPVKLM